jgi:cbb3-type cytochrome oxidase subunit 3
MFAKLKLHIHKRALPLLLVVLFVVFGFNKAISVMAASDFGIKGAAQGTSLIGTNQSVQANTTVPELIGKIVGFVLSFVGAIFFLLILYAGLLWMIAFGNGERVDKAKSIVEHAAVGLVIVLAAYAISRFVFSNLTSLGNNSQTPTNNPTAAECNAITNQAACDSAGCGWLEGSGCFL